jgi:hypothetical protein
MTNDRKLCIGNGYMLQQKPRLIIRASDIYIQMLIGRLAPA